MTHKFTAALAVLALICSGSATMVQAQDAAAPQTIKLTFKKASAGDFMGTLVKTNGSSTMSIIQGENEPGVRSNKSNVKQRQEVIVVETKDGVITKALVKLAAYETDREIPEGAGRRPRVTAKDLVGESYLVAIDGETVTVTNADGSEAEKEKAKYIQRRNVRNGVFTGWSLDFRHAIPEGEMKVGHKIVLTGDKAHLLPRQPRKAAAKDAEEKAESTLNRSLTITLTGTKKVLGREVAIFEFEELMSGTPPAPDQEGVTMSGTIKRENRGTLCLGLNDMWLYAMNSENKVDNKLNMSFGERHMAQEQKSDTKRAISILYGKKKTAAPKTE